VLTNYFGTLAVEGKLSFDGHDHKTIAEQYGGLCAYLPEDDEHFPQLTGKKSTLRSVSNSLLLALVDSIPNARFRLSDASARGAFTSSGSKQSGVLQFVQGCCFVCVLASQVAYSNAHYRRTILGLKHTYKTKVGNSFVRGVSGGERKRVSIAEALSTRATIMAHDNSTRGLDSSTALEYAKALRVVTDITSATTLLSIYQCGENLYNLFDKVGVIHSGRLIYFGRERNSDCIQVFL